MKISKRNFLKGSAALAAGTVLTSPAIADKTQRKWDKEVDVVVVGFGGAGANAAISAHDSGADVLIVEKLPTPGGNTSVSSGQVLFSKDKDETVKYIKQLFDLSHCDYNQELVETYAAGMLDVLPWLQSLDPDAKLISVNYATFPHLDGAKSLAYTGVKGKKGGGPLLMELYQKAVDKRQIPYWVSCPVKELIFDADRSVIGVRVQKDGKTQDIHAKKGVVLACGGYEYDPQTLQNFNLGTPIYALGCPGNTGDGLRMASQAGAQLWHMSGLSCPLGVRIPGKVPSQAFRTRLAGYILVDQDGKRFCDEKHIEHHIGILAVNYYDGHALKFPRIPCYAIFDENAKNAGPMAPTYGSGWLRHREGWTWSKDNNKEISEGIVKKAETLEGLAKQINVPAEALKESVKIWNEDMQSAGQKDRVFGRTKFATIKGNQIQQGAPLDKAPYYALELYPTLLNTQGGPRHDGKARVLDNYGKPIKGLYVAGELGSLWGFIYNGCGNNAEALVFGRIAGTSAAKGE